ncbi:hypothetical protein [Jonesia denitrificans]|uniref:Uncharacterized protein n=1 Tax=Jonesia denitrificans (strain ATCC 14870 / DSM 20603 / BCRC 15368 / CIP 55.134 / JCM 11481 / NBRC 15587 / NCTC 10816 / Prevot 55134) TaxID=471856 RepID=C7R339_JONDD|nr:hypothetical protein [Jonesia denitrificans]ACV10087.1 hypothetical protein Jden_2455 [Jonesia denitrificans DSM 20603]ASE08684.2 hypothetical protein CEP80_05730 [Jonesia denitrificans]QXB43290.1 hypothetical protein I6L70_12540 [Jonesia denitrificans]SQH22938.1 Uncharacterised protein [Jonesia denitrificans]
MTSPFLPPPPPNPRNHPAVVTDLTTMRKKWYLWSVPGVIAVLVLVIYTVSVLVPTAIGRSAYGNGQYNAAEEAFPAPDGWRPTDEWIDWYNHGTATLAAGGHSRALEMFTQARTHAPALPDDDTLSAVTTNDDLPPICRIDHNTALAHEALAEASSAQGMPLYEEFMTTLDRLADANRSEWMDWAPVLEDLRTAATPLFEEALSQFNQAKEVRAATACPDLSGAGERLDERITATEEILEYLQSDPPPPPPEEPPSEEEPSSSDSDEGSGGDEPPSDESPNSGEGNNEDGDGDGEGDGEDGGGDVPAPPQGEDDRQQQLQERNDAGQLEREETEGYLGGGYGGSGKPW